MLYCAEPSFLYIIGHFEILDILSVFIQPSIIYMLISSNSMISVLHYIMWSVGKNVNHKAKGKIVDLFEPWLAKTKL